MLDNVVNEKESINAILQDNALHDIVFSQAKLDDRLARLWNVEYGRDSLPISKYALVHVTSGAVRSAVIEFPDEDFQKLILGRDKLLYQDTLTGSDAHALVVLAQRKIPGHALYRLNAVSEKNNEKLEYAVSSAPIYLIKVQADYGLLKLDSSELNMAQTSAYGNFLLTYTNTFFNSSSR